MIISKGRLPATALALAGALVLAACGDGAATAPSSTAHGGDHRAGSDPSTASEAPVGNDADVAFLVAMQPHHEQAVEMSDAVLATDPPAPVAELARQVKAAQAPEIEQMQHMLADLGQDGDDAHAGGHMSGGHGGMVDDAQIEALSDATGADAARLYLEGMIEHHEGAIEAAEAQVADGSYEPAVELARRIAEDQAAEIAKMRALLASL